MSSLPTQPGPGQRLPFPPSEPPPSDGSGPAPDVILEVGDVLEGGYQIESRIGEGGVGVVYCALQQKLHRRVAIKLLLQDTVGEEEVRPRFQQEALTLAAVSHPHIVTLQDYGMTRGRPFLVMELLQGRTLREILDSEGPLAPVRTLTLLRQVVLALAYAHELGVVHRDLKPANLIVQTFPAYEHVKVLDFGMVKLLPGSQLDRGQQLTRIGFTFGTPGYMSPEHALGGEVDGRSDLYAVGVLLFELLTGEKPFDGEIQDILRAHLTSPVPELAQRRPELAEFPELQRLVERAMAKPVEERFANATALLAAIDELLMSGLMADPVDDIDVQHDDERAHPSVAPKLREALETAAAALSSYARASRGAWRDKASPQLRRARRELSAAAMRLAPLLRRLSHAAWRKLRPQIVRGAERVLRLAQDARQRIESRARSGAPPALALPVASDAEAPKEHPPAATGDAVSADQDATIVDLPANEPKRHAGATLLEGPRAYVEARASAREPNEARASAREPNGARPPASEPNEARASAREPKSKRTLTLASEEAVSSAAETAEPLTLEVRARKPSLGDP